MSQPNLAIILHLHCGVLLLLKLKQPREVQICQLLKISLDQVRNLVWILHLVLHANVSFHAKRNNGSQKLLQRDALFLVVSEDGQIKRVVRILVHSISKLLTVRDERQDWLLEASS